MYLRRGLGIQNFIRGYSTVSKIPISLSEVFKNPPKFDSNLIVQGWVRSVRLQKKIAFVDLGDGTTHELLSCVIDPELAQDLKTGASVKLNGTFCESRGKQEFELKVSNGNNGSLELIGDVPENYPLQKKSHTNLYLRTIPHLRWRAQTLSSILRFRSHVETFLMEFFNQNEFTKTSPPLITSSDCEGAGELFRIESNTKVGTEENFFGKDSYLTVSTQLHLEVLCMALSRVWTLSPCFRAEESDTNRHLSEFWMLEAEIAFIDDVHQLTRFSEKMIKHIVRQLIESGAYKNLVESRREKEEIENMTLRWNSLIGKELWDNITYTRAIEILQQAEKDKVVSFKYKPVWGNSLQSEHEKWLAGEYFKGPVSVTDYPKSLKPFYMKTNPDGKTVACYDLLVPEIGELIGGSIREHDALMLQNEIKERSMNASDIDWYLALRENGSVPHGGFGMGFERLLCYLAGVENIRDVIPFPRYAQNCSC